jgi:peptide/histidine transporter 3/4
VTSAGFITGSVVLERLAYYGIALNLVSYLTKVLHEGTAKSITNVWNWGGVAWITPLVGGFIADTYLGRYRTITYSLFIYLAVLCRNPLQHYSNYDCCNFSF